MVLLRFQVVSSNPFYRRPVGPFAFTQQKVRYPARSGVSGALSPPAAGVGRTEAETAWSDTGPPVLRGSCEVLRGSARFSQRGVRRYADVVPDLSRDSLVV